ncbi:unnamed protein product [Linum trigynum]|uniref:PB1 domain-containing protein n=1 Tax=Linum trigynum TaxID=586398 RepID=A0AAV2EN58_9ROSI
MTTRPDPPTQPYPPPSSAAPPTSAVYPDSVDSSPRSRTTESFYDEPPPISSKLRLMCSYGGRIVPRPHDKSFCYVGGDTRIVVVDCQASLSDLSAKLSTTLLNGRAFTLKYLLPCENLDSLISLTTDEDLDNMIDEYDRTSTGAPSNSSKPLGLRLFLFPVKPDSSQSDSLISLTTDEDLDNMIDEYDRTSTGAPSNSSKPSRLRLFLFPREARFLAVNWPDSGEQRRQG